jgi:hypothetical protein
MALAVYVDNSDITEIVLEGSVTHQHNRPSFASIRVPLQQVSGSWEAHRMRIYIGSTLDFHGSLVLCEDTGDEDTMYRVATFADPTFIWAYRPVRDADGDFSKPSIIADYVTGPQIVEAALTNSMVSGDPAIGEGPMGIRLGTFATGGVDLSGVPTDWPMSIEQLVQLLVDTGELDVVCTPVDDDPDYMGEVSAYNGDYGTDLTASVAFAYATGSHNARALRLTRDWRDLCNKLWLYAGPRRKTALDPAGDQHWAFNVTADDPGLADPPQSTIAAAIAASRALHYERMVIRIFDAVSEEEGAASRELYRRWWQMESWLRARPKTLVAITPQRGIAPSFRTGDLISVAAGSSFAGGFSGTQRVHEYTWRWTADGPIELGEPVGRSGVPAVVTSSDTEIA